jgi:hypothetical protein
VRLGRLIPTRADLDAIELPRQRFRIERVALGKPPRPYWGQGSLWERRRWVQDVRNAQLFRTANAARAAVERYRLWGAIIVDVAHEWNRARPRCQ